MDLYNEYNRIRKSLLQSARYRNLPTPSIPTAKQLGRKIRVSDIKKLSKQRISITSVKKSKTISTKSIKVPTAKIPKSSAKKSNFRTPNPMSNLDYFETYNTKVLATTTEGKIINKKTNEVITTVDFATKEGLGEYIKNNFTEEDFKLNDVSLPTEIELLKQYLSQRVQQAFDEHAGGHRSAIYYQFGGGSESAGKQIEDAVKALDATKILAQINKMDDKQAQKAKKTFESYKDEIRNYIDIALFYTSDDDGDHVRALDYILELLGFDLINVVERPAELPNYGFDDLE